MCLNATGLRKDGREWVKSKQIKHITININNLEQKKQNIGRLKIKDVIINILLVATEDYDPKSKHSHNAKARQCHLVRPTRVSCHTERDTKGKQLY